MIKPIRLACAAAALTLLSLSVPAPRAEGAQGTMTEMPDGLKYVDTQTGSGAIAVSGRTVTVQYTGWLYQNGKKGTKFDSSYDHGEPFSFKLGGGHVIKGWDEGVPGMRVGGKRTLIIPPQLAYGAHGAGDVIPPFATLIFDVELMKVE